MDALLDAVRTTVRDAFDHQDVPFERVVDDLRPERDPSRTPLFQVMVVLQNSPAESPALPGLAVEGLDPATVTASFDLTIEFQEVDKALRFAITYSTDLFDAATVERLAEHLTIVLSALRREPTGALVTSRCCPGPNGTRC